MPTALQTFRPSQRSSPAAPSAARTPAASSRRSRAPSAAELDGAPSYPNADLDEPHEDVCRLADAIVGLGGRLSPAQQAKRDEALRRRDAWFEELCGELPPALRTAPPRSAPRLARNAPCHCGSGRKYKKCHLDADAAA